MTPARPRVECNSTGGRIAPLQSHQVREAAICWWWGIPIPLRYLEAVLVAVQAADGNEETNLTSVKARTEAIPSDQSND